jgi:DNA-binding response OmpR family regulator
MIIKEETHMYNILICDDEQDIINALKIYLSDSNYEVFEAHNGLEAIDAVSQKDIHLVLLDIMMPVMDGISALVKLREISNVPVILLTILYYDMLPIVMHKIYQVIYLF